jgi:signal peptidase II
MMSGLLGLRMVWLGLAVAAAALALDQAVKYYFLYGLGMISCCVKGPTLVEQCNLCSIIEVTPFFSINMVWNYGVSFGLFPAEDDVARFILIGFQIFVSLALFVWLLSVRHVILAAAIGLVIGGALGNVIDRFIYGAVADFFDFHLFGYHWYIFNVADAAIVVGVALLLLDALVLRRDEGERKETTSY